MGPKHATSRMFANDPAIAACLRLAACAMHGQYLP